MSCTIDAIKINIFDKASNVLTNVPKGLREVKPGVYEISRSRSLSLNKAYDKAQEGRENLRKWAEKTYGGKYQWGWTTLDKGHPNKITVTLRVPIAVEQVLRVKLGLISIEEANEMQPFIKDAEQFSKDPALAHQEMMSDTKFYSEISEIMPNLAGAKEGLNESLEFEYDKTQETDIMLTDAELFRLLNDDLNIC